MLSLYRHNKTGNLYMKIGMWVNCNNGSEMNEVVYIGIKPFHFMIFHREENEFYSKFTKVS